MFKKLLANLAFNPSLIGQVNFYYGRLRQETALRRIGFVMLALAVVVQLIAAMFPAQKSLAASPNNDVIKGGVSSLPDLKSKCEAPDNNKNPNPGVRGLYKRFGLDCSDMVNRGVDNVSFNYQAKGQDGVRTVGRSNFSFTDDNRIGPYGASQTHFYSRNAAEWQGSEDAYYFGVKRDEQGRSYKVWIIKHCGNIAYELVESPPTLTPVSQPAIVPPEATCTRLTASKTSGKKSFTVLLTAEYTQNQSGVVTGATFNFGDGNSIDHRGFTVEHTYTTNNGLQPKVYIAQATINSSAGNKTSAACQVVVSVLPDTCSTNPAVLADDKNCGACKYNPNFTPTDSRCTPSQAVCPNDPNLKPDDAKCKCTDNPNITAADKKCGTIGKLKTVRNITRNQTPEQTIGSTVKAGDVIEYKLISTNTNLVAAKTGYNIEDYIGDVLDYANLDDAFLKAQGGTFSADKKTVIWTNQTIPPGGDLAKAFRVTLKNPVPTTNQPSITAPDFDCKIQNSYGNETGLNVNCPIIKSIDKGSTNLPNTGPGTSVTIGVVIVTISGYFFSRSRIMARELAIIRSEYVSAGGF
jgi:hypothetical protein